MQDNVIKNTDDIRAEEKKLELILKDHYTLDYYQREYKWKKEHIEQLIEDLESAFQEFYRKEHNPQNVADYGTYYMGPVVFSKNKQKQKSIVDGQQRLTSLTLLLLYLEHLQKGKLKLDEPVEEIRGLIYSSHLGQKNFNIRHKERDRCMKALLERGDYELTEEDTTSARNIVGRYNDIDEKDSIWKEDKHALRLFLYWLIEKVILVEITAATLEKAYLIFETMNDRGLRLTAVDMLKAYLLYRVKDPKDQQELDNRWKTWMQKLNESVKKDADSAFFQAWLRGRYAKTIRGEGKKDTGNQDFENIATRFHTWVRDKIKLPDSRTWYQFIDKDIRFYINCYLKYRGAREKRQSGLEHLYRVNFLGFADSLLDPLILAPIKETDDEATIEVKMNLVAFYVEAFCVRRKVNFHGYAHSALRVRMYQLVREIRQHQDIPALKKILKDHLSKEEMKDSLNGITKNEEGNAFALTGMNKPFIRFFLASLTAYVEQGKEFNLEQYMPKKKPYDIEHIVGENYDKYRTDYKKAGYEERWDFDRTRNLIGGFLLLPPGVNRSFSNKPFGMKGKHYIRENLLAQSLCARCYESNPDFRRLITNENLPFKWYLDDEKNGLSEQQKSYMSPEAEKQQRLFSKDAIWERQKLYQAIAEKIWGLDFFDD